jgi:protein-S-isoprenylcysteine O-methyltransferase Ste14
MGQIRKFFYGLNRFLLSSIAGALTVAQVVLAFFLHGDGLLGFKWAGWICIWVSAVFGMLPVFTFRAKGGVEQGQSYMKTSVLVDTGIYAIVRHPQGGTAWLFINIGVMMVAWHWSSLVLGLTSMALVYADTFKTDQYCIDKFGEEYTEYIKRVPRVNFVVGLIRKLRSRS